jgi:iron complex outermembrane receptor protein
MLKPNLRNLLGHVSFFVLLSATGVAVAQDRIIERITVTAERRAADVQKVPIAITAITGEQLDTRGVDGFEDLKYQVPSLSFGGQVTGGENFITLRGVGNENLTGGGDSGVAYHTDGVYLGRNVAVDKSFYDMERVEVLRGPQGTLYGRNSTGGAFNVITKKPVFDFEANADVLFGDYDRRRVRGMVNVPLAGDQIALRVSGVAEVRDGYQDNIAGSVVCGDCEGKDADDHFNLRGHVLVKVTDDIELLVSASVYENNEMVATKLNEPFPAVPGRFVGALPNPTDKRDVRKDFPEGADINSHVYSATLNWQLEGMELTSITSYADLFWNQQTDGDGSELPIAFTPYWRNDSDQVSQEIRLASTDEGTVDWIVGVFFYHEDVQQEFQFIDSGLNPGFLPPAVIPFIFTNGGNIRTTSFAAFGQVDYHIEDGLFGYRTTLTGGLRYTYDRKSGHDFLNLVNPGVPSSVTFAKEFEIDWETPTGKIGMQIEFSEDTSAYATVSRGYRSGGDLVGNFPGLYDPEYIWNYEVGVKTRTPSGRLQTNVALFWSDYEDIQIFIQEAGLSRIENAAAATIKGLEVELTALPTDQLTLNVGFAWLDAEYDEFITEENRFEFQPAAPQNLAGNRLNRTPEFTVLLGAEYAFLTDFGTITARADFMWQSEVFFRAQNLPVDRQDDYNKTDLRVIWTDPGEVYEIEAFIENVEDEDVISNMVLPVQTLGGPSTQITLNPPRTVGIRFGVNF